MSEDRLEEIKNDVFSGGAFWKDNEGYLDQVRWLIAEVERLLCKIVGHEVCQKHSNEQIQSLTKENRERNAGWVGREAQIGKAWGETVRLIRKELNGEIQSLQSQLELAKAYAGKCGETIDDSTKKLAAVTKERDEWLKQREVMSQQLNRLTPLEAALAASEKKVEQIKAKIREAQILFKGDDAAEDGWMPGMDKLEEARRQ